jgi:hypothetical protein
MQLPGHVRIAARKMALATNRAPYFFYRIGDIEYLRVFELRRLNGIMEYWKSGILVFYEDV